MIKLLIADDEHIVIESIKFIVKKFVAGVEVIGAAGSGKEAIEKTLRLKPDVVFMDIHMPGINGLDAIRHIQEHDREIIFVIITAYEYFQYAREAVNLGVYEYLLKPLNKNTIIATLREISAVIRSQRENLAKETALMEKVEKILPHIEGQFIYSQLFDSGVIRDLDFYEEVFAMQLRQGYVMVAILDEPDAATREEGLLNSLMKQQLYENFQVILKDICPCLIGLPLLDRIVAFIPVSADADSYQVRNRAIEIAKAVIKKTTHHYRIGIGRKNGLEQFSESYQEACIAAVLAEGDQITHFEDVRLSAPPAETYPYPKEKLFLQQFTLGDLQGTLDLFEELHTWIALNYKEEPYRIKSKLIELFVLTQRALPETGPRSAAENNLLPQLLKADQASEIKIDFINYLKRTLLDLAAYRKKELNGLILKATRYIDENYRRNITLDDVARAVNMSYHYFSRFFKETTGKNFSEYLTGLRVEQAKQLLKESGENIKTVCFAVGYSDPNYFCKIFKKQTGLTPTEYRRLTAAPGGGA